MRHAPGLKRKGSVIAVRNPLQRLMLEEGDILGVKNAVLVLKRTCQDTKKLVLE